MTLGQINSYRIEAFFKFYVPPIPSQQTTAVCEYGKHYTNTDPLHGNGNATEFAYIYDC